MAKRGGFPGGGMPGNMNNLMKQAQRMQRQMEEQQKEMENREFEATAGGGAVKLVITGAREVKSLEIDKDAVDPEDVETLQDLLIAAMNEALRMVEEANGEAMGNMAGGLDLGGLRF
ncbi:MAG: YbaB/EbfC family nucleoid-associated protein [Lachnospiraceae bacterium]|nr:YbaB/EbfC family nucleoid-associated protein [Lachnospiraceae bacterium]